MLKACFSSLAPLAPKIKKTPQGGLFYWRTGCQSNFARKPLIARRCSRCARWHPPRHSPPAPALRPNEMERDGHHDTIRGGAPPGRGDLEPPFRGCPRWSGPHPRIQDGPRRGYHGDPPGSGPPRRGILGVSAGGTGGRPVPIRRTSRAIWGPKAPTSRGTFSQNGSTPHTLRQTPREG